MDEKWIEELTVDMLPEFYQQVVSIIGVDNFLNLCKEIGGTNMYIPKLDSVIRPIRDKKIRKEFNGANYKDLAIKYNLCERWVRDIINPKECEGQINLFEMQAVK
ncbi:Mor transcription activator family protein [Anaerovorax sp. IOR16]|uniref:Mor transcription activator family protein n=1 Tax=Anaerovorax sp. IOR16 TaxID=2773458 RepID=UPI0019D075EA|nr:Mor transcription activator family protein [Anaerovorax sp. IOR16]